MLRYCGPFLFPITIPLFFYIAGPVGPLATAVLVPLVLIGCEAISPRGDAFSADAHPHLLRALVLFYIPLQLALIGWAIWASVTTSPLGFATLVLSVGVTTGVFGMLAAHEAVHSGDRFEGFMGTLMLTGMTYRHFRISHVYGHHRWAATPRDPGTARLGEGFYRFLLRTTKGQFIMAFRFEERRRMVGGRRKGMNRVAADVIVMAVVFSAIFLLTGWRGLSFFLLQSGVGITTLELFSYISHYGMARRLDEKGMPEGFSDSHSWNSSNVMANALIFNMGRHSFHHARPAAPYQGLVHVPHAPELPAGYAGSILLALAPPLWRRVMDDKVRRMVEM